jgi:hypothetical protein
MKTFKIRIALVMLLLATLPIASGAKVAIERSSVTPASAEASLQAEKLLNRLNEIDQMDKSDMKRSDKKQLRMEVKTIKKQLSELNGGIYLSVGAVIIIILLLILLL